MFRILQSQNRVAKLISTVRVSIVLKIIVGTDPRVLLGAFLNGPLGFDSPTLPLSGRQRA